jgi:signal transduction histidine kinase/CheY-like chemotaxis protein
MEVAIFLLFVIVGLVIFWFSQRQKFKQELLSAQRMTARAKQSLDEREKFLAYTNHEIRTPLNAVSGSTELLLNTQLSKDQAKYVSTIKASVDNVLVLVNDVLDLARIESGKINIQERDFILSDLLLGIKLILGEKAQKKGIELKYQIDEKVPVILKGDSRYLNQIILNLANNAVKFTDLGSVTMKVSVAEVNQDNYTLKFEIIDTGKGIRKSKLPTIFNQFEQETRHTIKHKGGSGLGLAISKQLVEAQGGSIHVESKYMEGTNFWFQLDYQKGDPIKKSSHSLDTSVLDGLRVLVVDDNKLNREIMCDLLHGLNSKSSSVAVEGGERCIELLKLQDFDLILMDIQMPGMDGYELSQYIRKNARSPIHQIPIIAMTAFAFDDAAKKCFEAGMNDYMSKPVESKILLSKIRRLFEKKKKSTEMEIDFDYCDLSKLKALTGGDNLKMYKYIDIFLQNTPIDLDRLTHFIKSENADEGMKALHKLKGSAAYMGNTDLPRIYDKIIADGADYLFALGQHEKQIANICKGMVNELNKLKSDHKFLFLK